MFRLRVLGGFALEGPSGTAAFPVPQRRVEAVLAVLAVCGDVGCTRERVIALLWPESDEARSRRALRNSLHTLRQALGPGAVLSAGELLRLDPAVIESDVHRFVEALGSGRLADAAEAYGGPLLDGFHVDAAPDFERWLDGERARLARQVAEALEHLARAAEDAGAWGEAAGWWARAEEHDPLNSHFALRHARALVAIRDRANAIQVAEAHARRLREELGVEPDAAVLAEIEGLRRGGLTALPEHVAPATDGVARGPVISGAVTASHEAGAAPLAEIPAGAAHAAQTARRRRRLALGSLAAVAGLVAIGALGRTLVRREPEPRLDPTAIAVLPFQVVSADSLGPARPLARSMGYLFELKLTPRFGWHIRHPGSVSQRWREAGGALDSALPAETERAVARAVGAGRLVRGTLVATGDSLVVSASMVDAATGAVQVPPVRAEGRVAQFQELVDQVIILLLAHNGFMRDPAPHFVHYKPEAVQAYLAGAAAPFSAQKAFFRVALAADSSLVDAAVMVYAVGENVSDTAELRYAWDHRDRLTERSRAYLQVLAAGLHGPIRTESEKIAAYEDLTRRWPEWRSPWGDVGDQLIDYGALASVPDWPGRAREAFDRMEVHWDWVWWHYTELAFVAGDAGEAGPAIDSLAAHAGASEGIAALVPAYRWRLAVLRGDPGDAARRLARLPDSAPVLQFALTDGRGVSRVLDSVAPHVAPLGAMWAWARGHERPWREAWRRYGSPAGGISQATVPVFWALLLGPSEDTMAASSVRRLERVAYADGGPRLGADDRALARCWLALWRIRHGDTAGAEMTRRYLESGAALRYRFAGWARLVDVLLAEKRGGDVHGALLAMDSVVRELPLPTGYRQWDPMPSELQNLVLARMLARYGEPRLALRAARRRIYRAVFNYPDALPEYLREEGRLAAVVGDTAGAIRTYRHYLALREDPDPRWRPAWDSVRAELAALTAR